MNKFTRIILSPFFKVLRTKTVRNAYLRRNVQNPDELVEDALINPAYGYNSIKSIGFMNLLVVQFFLGFIFIAQGMLKELMNVDLFLILGIALAGLSYTINYFLIDREKIYIMYFKEFSNFNSAQSVKYGWLSAIVVFFIFLFPVFGFCLMDYLINR